MATHSKEWRRDGLVGTYYRFDRPGEGIAMHSHAHYATRHDTRVIQGSVVIYGDMPERTAHTGEHVKFPSYRQHEIVALEPNTEIINVLINPTPEQAAYSDETESSIEPVLLGRLTFQDTTW